jgi:gliding motility-associated-like protein
VFYKLISLFVLLPLTFNGQLIDKRWDTWYFQSRVGLKINGCNEIPLRDGGCGGAAGVCTISDSAGNLLFYSNSQSVWNKKHQVMPNGNLYGWGGGVYHYQGPVIMPQPGNDSLYYMFHVHPLPMENGDYPTEFHFNIINKNADNGNGDLIVKEKKLYFGTTEATAAVLNANNKDYWIVSHKKNSDSFVVYKLTAAGLDMTPTYYKIGDYVAGGWRDRQLVIKFSPDRKKMVLTRNIRKSDPNNYIRDGGFDLFDFDATTGAISNPIIIRDGFVSNISTGAEFSPDSKVLYVSTMDHLFQFDVSVHDFTQINVSRIMISSPGNSFGHILLASNGKIYVSKFLSNDYLGIIEKPNVLGATCNFKPDGVYFPGLNWNWGLYLGWGLNNCIQPYLRHNRYLFSDLLADKTCFGDSSYFRIKDLIADSVKWDFADPVSGKMNYSDNTEPSHFFASTGNYRVRCIIFNPCAIDTLEKDVLIHTPALYLGADTVICSNVPVTLRSNITGAQHLWKTGSMADSLTVMKPGQYWVEVTKAGCKVSDTIVILFKSPPLVNLGIDTTICTGASLKLTAADPSIDSYLWSAGSNTTPSINVQNAGEYFVQVQGKNGCLNYDTIKISVTPLPNFTLGHDTVLCDGQRKQYVFNLPGAFYTWNTGSQDKAITIQNAGLYWLEVTQNGCTAADSVLIQYKPLPIVNLGPDTILCEGSGLQLHINGPYTSLLWQDGSTTANYYINRKGRYSIRASLDGCSSTDTINVNYNSMPKLFLGADTVLCEGMAIDLYPKIFDTTGIFYLWSNGLTDSKIKVTTPGIYGLKVMNQCGSSSDEIIISKGVCKIIVPDAFTPNNDNRNDVFRALFGENVVSFKMQIFNRWGQLIFQSNDIRKGWDGTVNGQPQSTGQYVWQISYKFFNQPNPSNLHGLVNLIR